MFSLTQSGVYLTAIATFLGVTQDEVSGFTTTVVAIVGLIMAWYGRYRKGDVTFFGFRK